MVQIIAGEREKEKLDFYFRYGEHELSKKLKGSVVYLDKSIPNNMY